MSWTRLPLRRRFASGREVAPAPAPRGPLVKDARYIAYLRRRLVREPDLHGATALAITQQLLRLQAHGEP